MRTNRLHSFRRRDAVLLLLALSAAPNAAAQCWSDRFGSSVNGGAGFDDLVTCFAEYAPAGPATKRLYVGGWFTQAGGVNAIGVALWDGTNWYDVNGGVSGGLGVSALEVFDDGSGPKLYAAGDFTSAGGVPASGIACFDGVAWQPVGGGLSGSAFGQTGVFDLQVFDDGTGPALYAVGDFTNAGGLGVQNVAKWDGVSWSDVGQGIFGPYNGCCPYGMGVFDDGTGSKLYVGGDPGTTGTGVPMNGVIAWDGQNWSPLGSGLGGGPFNFAAAFAVYDDGTGPALYVGGDFAQAGGVTVNHVARWDGQNWSALGSGLSGTQFPYGGSGLGVYDSGQGNELFVAGLFTDAGGAASAHIARFDGQSWQSAQGGVFFDEGYSSGGPFFVYDEGAGPELWSCGYYLRAGAVDSNFVGRWSSRCPSLSGGPAFASLGAGGVQSLEIRAGVANAGRTYIVLGSVSGITPGIPVGTGVLPLNFDPYFLLTTADPSPPFVNGTGVLDGQGRANVAFIVPPGSAPQLAGFGITLNHAALVLSPFGSPKFATNATYLTLTQ